MAVGDSYEGGICGYIFTAWRPWVDADVQHGLIISASDQSNRVKQWNLWSRVMDHSMKLLLI
ncbi:hypothetical protein QWY92_19560, partial [Algibacter miyuki]|nr:hypothetical protein [Algibacter miyuki]